MSVIDVDCVIGASSWKCSQLLRQLEKEPLLSFDTETSGVYSKKERKEALKMLDEKNIVPRARSHYSLIANNSGLSFPSLVNTTHFIFGVRNNFSVVLVTSSRNEEMKVWNWLIRYQGHLIIHNSLFDLKIMYHRVRTFPKHYTDTALLAKCLINNADNYKSLIGLKELMGNYYIPEWSLFDNYEPEDLMNPSFLEYAAIDGAATLHLWEDLQEHLREQTGN